MKISSINQNYNKNFKGIVTIKAEDAENKYIGKGNKAKSLMERLCLLAYDNGSSIVPDTGKINIVSKTFEQDVNIVNLLLKNKVDFQLITDKPIKFIKE